MYNEDPVHELHEVETQKKFFSCFTGRTIKMGFMKSDKGNMPAHAVPSDPMNLPKDSVGNPNPVPVEKTQKKSKTGMFSRLKNKFKGMMKKKEQMPQAPVDDHSNHMTTDVVTDTNSTPIRSRIFDNGSNTNTMKN